MYNYQFPVCLLQVFLPGLEVFVVGLGLLPGLADGDVVLLTAELILVAAVLGNL